MTRTNIGWTGGLLVGTLVAAAQAAVPGVIETWDAGLNGWTGNTTSSVVVHAASGGNPGGYVLARKDLTPPVFDTGIQTTSATYTGDFAADGITGVSFDVNLFNTPLDNIYFRVRRNAAENGWRFPFGPAAPGGNAWGSFSVSFDPTWSDADAQAAGWVTDMDVDPAAAASPSFATVMSGVGRTEVRFESIGSAVTGIDNFVLLPEPTSAALLMGLSVVGLARHRRGRGGAA